MGLACLIAAAGILEDQPILIVGAMVVGPEFGPLAGLSVALVEKRRDLARRSLTALAVGFPLGTLLALLATLLFKATGVVPDEFDPGKHPQTSFITEPGFFSFFVAFVAGIAGVLSLTSAKSGALIGVLVSVTTIPAAANIGVATAYGSAPEAAGAAIQLGVNLLAIVMAGVLTLYLQRRLYVRRRRKHLDDPARKEGAPAPGQEPQGEDCTSSFTRTRSMTESVNSVVDAWPPRSAVRHPAPDVSSTASRSARPAASAPS